MTSRVSRRVIDVPEVLDLPTVEAPQYVDENGYEVAAETFAQVLVQAAEPRVDGDHVDPSSTQGPAYTSEEALDGEEDEEIVADEEAVEEDEGEHDGEAVEEEEPELGEPLLSLSDSNVLHYSLKATRQHHLKHLLPHVFSHPVIPANSRPRARPPPKGTFLWPTPPPLVHPLPHREYHAPTKTSSSNNEASTPPAGDGTPDPPTGATDQPGTIKRKYGRGKGKGKEKMDGVEAPAHEIECLARITLSIGPISFPESELWVGRFVQPRAAAPKPPKVQREKTERKRPTAAADGAGPGPKRPRMKPGPVPRPPAVRPTAYPPYQPAAGPTNYRPPPRPVGAPGPPYPGQTTDQPGHPGHPGPPRPPPPRAELSPDLIRRVNEAATQHPWLSQIIHKAARTQATKEELAKLGRVVNRLKEGKDVGEGPDDPAPPPIQNMPVPPATGSAGPVPRPPTVPASAPVRPPPPQSAPNSVQSSAIGPSTLNAPRIETLPVPTTGTDMSRTLSNSSGPLTPPPNDGDSDDDSDVDMSGPRQVGGGPGGIDPALIDPALKDGADPEGPAPSAAVRAPMSPAQPVQNPTGPPIATSTNPPQPPHSQYRHPDSSNFSAPSQYRPPNPTMAAPYAQIRPPYPYSQQYPPGQGPAPYTSPSPAPQAPPPPRPTYPLPPPFLLVAFKEAPTEKFLLPLGSLSYVSRQGGDPELWQPLAIPPTPIPTQPVPEPSSVSNSTPTTTDASVPIKSRTRASLGRNAKVPSPEPQTPPAKPEPTIESPDVPKKPDPPRSGLNSLPGMEPLSGTVLLSTFIPAGEWQKPDWNALSKSLPFNNNPLFEPKAKSTTEVKVESPSTVTATANGDVAASPRSATKRNPKASEAPRSENGGSAELLPVRGKLLNLASESFISEETEVHAVTIRLGDVTDAVWQRIKTISGMIVTAEMKSLAEQEPSLMAAIEPSKPAPEVKSESVPSVGSSVTTNMPPLPPAAPAQPPLRPGFHPSAELKDSYLTRKRNWFQTLLKRVATRKFLRFRLSSPRPDIIDATADKWAPRPYPISTKALYTREEEENAEELLLLSPELQPRKGNKKLPEPTVTFEMPVSLDQLDERVAESTMSGKKLKGEDGRKRHGKRWVPGTICEGCGQSGKRVWRAGPGGKGTLCNSCGDKWTSGILGPLVAPSASIRENEPNDKDEDDASNPAGATGDGVDSKTIDPAKIVEANSTNNVDPVLTTDPKPTPAPVPDQPTEISVSAGVGEKTQRNGPSPAGNSDADAGNARHGSTDVVDNAQTHEAGIIRMVGDDAMDVDPPHSLQVEQTDVTVPTQTVDTTDSQVEC